MCLNWKIYGKAYDIILQLLRELKVTLTLYTFVELAF